MKLSLILFVVAVLLLGCAQKEISTDQDITFTALNDTDKDGVIDARDTCPKTGVNIDVTNTGCPIWKNVENLLRLL